MLKLRKNKKGFTLVELIVVIAIMAVLAGTIAGVTVTQLNKQTNSSAQSEADTLVSQLKTFMVDVKIGEGTGYDYASFDAAIAAFATEVSKNEVSENDATDALTLKDPKVALPKAGEHKFVYSISGEGTQDKPYKVTIECAQKGSNVKQKPEAVYIYKDAFSD